MTEFFTDPEQPSITYEYMHEHEWFEVGAVKNPNGTWTSLWACKQCPDIGRGGHVGPVPPGFCGCGWVQKKWPRKRCEDCGRRRSATRRVKAQVRMTVLTGILLPIRGLGQSMSLELEASMNPWDVEV